MRNEEWGSELFQISMLTKHLRKANDVWSENSLYEGKYKDCYRNTDNKVIKKIKTISHGESFVGNH